MSKHSTTSTILFTVLYLVVYSLNHVAANTLLPTPNESVVSSNNPVDPSVSTSALVPPSINSKSSPIDEAKVQHKSDSGSPVVVPVGGLDKNIATQVQNANATTITTNTTSTPEQKLTMYFEPVCALQDKLSQKQLFKIQSQLKQFVEKTAGKMSFCFMDHYGLDPNLDVISSDQIQAICLSRDIPSSHKHSFSSFQACAKNNWDANLEKYIDQTHDARVNCTKNHEHSKTDPTASLNHDADDEIILTNTKAHVDDVTNHHHHEVTNAPAASLVAVIQPTVANTAANSSTTSSASPIASNSDSTLVVVLPDRTATTQFPKSTIDKNQHLNHVADVTTQSNNGSRSTLNTLFTTTKPNHVSLELPVPKVHGTTVAPVVAPVVATIVNETTTTKSPSVLNKIENVSTTISPNLVSSIIFNMMTTPLPSEEQTSSTSSAPSTTTTTKSPTTSTTTSKKPERTLETLEAMLRRQEEEKQHLEKKMREDREKLLQQLRKQQDEIDAQNAIRAMQYQRLAAGHSTHSDAVMHQLEHERQMSIDPIGHTMKHQEYEFKRRNRAFAHHQ